MQSNEEKLRVALQELADEYVLLLTDYFAAPHKKYAENSPVYKKAMKALALPSDDVKSVLQDALNVLGCLEYGSTGVDSWPCEDSVESVVHRIRKVLEESQ